MSAPHGATDPEGEGIFPLLALLLAVVLALVLVTISLDRDRKEAEAKAAVAAGVESPAQIPGTGPNAGPLLPPPDPTTGKSAPLAGIEEMLGRLVQGRSSAAELASFKAALLSMPPSEVIAAIREFLATGGNARTGQGFEVAPGGGALAAQPTLRLLLLDVLGQAARKLRSGDAAAVSRTILETKDSPDEWALALRNVAWAEPQSRAYVAGKVREMIAHPAWREQPSDGLLEALDVAVWTQDATLVPDLLEARSANQEMSHAVDIALDRMADAAPLEVMTYLNTHPTTLAERPLLRADYFAKADFTNGAQRSQVELYLGRPDVALEEKTKLLRALVTPASFVGDTLVAAPPPADDGSARRAALALATGDWVKTQRFPALQSQLVDLQARLAP